VHDPYTLEVSERFLIVNQSVGSPNSRFSNQGQKLTLGGPVGPVENHSFLFFSKTGVGVSRGKKKREDFGKEKLIILFGT